MSVSVCANLSYSSYVICTKPRQNFKDIKNVIEKTKFIYTYINLPALICIIHIYMYIYVYIIYIHI